MVEGLQHFPAHGFLQLLKIDDEAGAWVHFSFHRDFERVIVPVPVGVIALAKDALVLLPR